MSQRRVTGVTADGGWCRPKCSVFDVFKINEGGEHYVKQVATTEEAEAQIRSFAEFWPAEYAVLNLETGRWSRVRVHGTEKGMGVYEDSGSPVRQRIFQARDNAVTTERRAQAAH